MSYLLQRQNFITIMKNTGISHYMEGNGCGIYNCMSSSFGKKAASLRASKDPGWKDLRMS